MPYHSTHYYDAFTDTLAVRFSMFDSHGSEFWMKVPKRVSGKAWREERRRALDAIETAVEMGLEPGEVVVE